MALLDAFKKETTQILDRVGGPTQNMLGANFRTYGAQMGILDYDEYVQYARRIYTEAMANPSGFTIIEMPNGGVAIDFQTKIRGIYNAAGEPMAFFKPDYRQLGFKNEAEELREFQSTITETLH